jgi:hypothetical protein
MLKILAVVAIVAVGAVAVVVVRNRKLEEEFITPR